MTKEEILELAKVLLRENFTHGDTFICDDNELFEFVDAIYDKGFEAGYSCGANNVTH